MDDVTIYNNEQDEKIQKKLKNIKFIFFILIIIILQIILIKSILSKNSKNTNNTIKIIESENWKIIKTENYKNYSNYKLNETILKIALLSDSHIDIYNPLKTPFIKTLKQSLQTIKNQKVDIIIFAGDLVDTASKESFLLWKKIYHEIFPLNSSSPILLLIMGNHDYYLNNNNYYLSINQTRTLFEETFNQKFQDHYLINDFHFILWGNIDDENNNKSKCNFNWVKYEIEKIIKNDKNEEKNFPIFVITHFPPLNTTHQSNFWGNKYINLGLNNYNNIINLCGHSHSSLIDERAIDQFNFTVINSQSTSRVCTEKSENGYIAKDEFGNDNISYKNYMGVILFLKKGFIEVKRIFLDDNSFYNKFWVIPFPIFHYNFNYTFNRVKFRNKPFFDQDLNVSIYKKNDKYYIKFKQAIHEDFVYGYNITFYNDNYNKTYKYISDFFLKEKDRREYITFLLNNNLTKGKYNITIIAYDSFEITSLNNITKEIELQ